MAAPAAVPKYSLQFPVLPDSQPIEDPDNLHISDITLTPPNAPVNPIVLKLLEGMAKDYVSTLGAEFRT